MAVADLLPRLLAHAGSFTIISFFWVGHWRRFKLIDRADTGLAYVNLLLLAFIALIPFPPAEGGCAGGPGPIRGRPRSGRVGRDARFTASAAVRQPVSRRGELGTHHAGPGGHLDARVTGDLSVLARRMPFAQ